MSGTFAPALTDTQKPEVKVFTISFAQPAGTYDLCTASGDIDIEAVDIYIQASITGLTSVSVQTNDTSIVQILSALEGLLTNLTGGKNLKSFTNRFLLASGKKIQYTIAGTGSGGSMKVAVRYMRGAAGADIS